MQIKEVRITYRIILKKIDLEVKIKEPEKNQNLEVQRIIILLLMIFDY